MTPFRVCAVPYLNMLPLVAGLSELRLPAAGRGEPDTTIALEATPPGPMAERMDRGLVDLGMAPVGAILERPGRLVVGCFAVPHGCGLVRRATGIGSRGRVRSVAIFSGGPLERARRFRPDAHSRSSNALARILLARRFGGERELGPPVPLEGFDPPARPDPDDAFLLIGDRALRWDEAWRERGGTVTDLGEAWTEWTGLPFVFALWTLREGADPDALRVPEWMAAFERLKRRNLARLDELVGEWRRAEETPPVSEAGAREYLRDRIRFDQDEAALAGLRRYHAEGIEMGLFPAGPPIDDRILLQPDPPAEVGAA